MRISVFVENFPPLSSATDRGHAGLLLHRLGDGDGLELPEHRRRHAVLQILPGQSFFSETRRLLCLREAVIKEKS